MMKRICIIFLSLLFVSGWCAPLHAAKEYFVSPAGDDTWSGELPEPNKSGNDGPFKTPEKARDTVRELKKASGLPAGGVTVTFREGIYPLSNTFRLTGEDSGAEDSPVVYRAYPGEEVRFIGGKVLTGFEPVTDEAVRQRFDESCRDRIVRCDLKAQGITDYGTMTQTQGLGMELFFQNKRMIIARYPNDGWLYIASVPQTGELKFEGSIPYMRWGIYVGRHYGRFTYDGDRPDRWAESDDIWMFGYWSWDWAADYQHVLKIDRELKEVYPEPPYHYYGYTKKQRYYFLNILEEVDSPGEYYIDRDNGILYFYPPADIGEGDAFVSIMTDTLVYCTYTSFVTIQGITVECAQKTAVSLYMCKDTILDSCTVRNAGGSYAVVLSGGERNGIMNSSIYDVAAGGIILSAGIRRTLTPGNCFITNSHIHHFNRQMKTYYSGISLNGVGNIVSHNSIHDTPYLGIAFSGNDLIIEYNEIYNTVLESNDAGAIGCGRNPSEQGNIIRYNYFHHNGREIGHGTTSVYLDDGNSGYTIFGNVFFKAGLPGVSFFGAVFIHNGRFNVVDNNLFVECEQAYAETRMDDASWKAWLDSDTIKPLLYSQVNISKPPFSEKYPWLPDIKNDTRKNTVSRNVVYNCKSFYRIGQPELVDNMITSEDPGFVALADSNFMLRDDSVVYSKIPGFQKVPFDQMGLLKDTTPTSVREHGPDLVWLHQNNPNPFNPVTAIRFTIPKSGQVKLTVYNMLGQEVVKLADGRMTAGTHSITFNGGNLASGVYVYRLEYGNVVKTKKMLMVK